MKIAFIGKGRVATHMSKAFLSAQHDVVMCGGKTRLFPVPADADVVIISIKDDAIEEVAREFIESDALILHTSGSVSIEVIPSKRRGVLYPMQTFSFEREVDFRHVPLFLETSSEDDMHLLSRMAHDISDKQYPLNSNQRKTLHLAAVLCCNFVNHLLVLSHEVLNDSDIPFHTLLPLIDETIAKIHYIPPVEAQTGPAVRWDEKVISSHIDMLRDPLHKEIYRLLSESIRKTFINSQNK